MTDPHPTRGKEQAETSGPVRFCRALDILILRIGRIFMWSNGLLVLVIIFQVILRYVFHHGLVALEELEWHLYAVGIMTGAAFAMVKDLHIRVDLFQPRMSRSVQHWVEILGALFLLLPFLGVVFYHSLDFVHEAWRLSERSVSPMGLPCRWVIKSFIPFGFGLMILAALSRTAQSILALWRNDHGAQ